MLNAKTITDVSVFVLAGAVLLMLLAESLLPLVPLLSTQQRVRHALGNLSIDFFEWVRHRVHHRVPLLWRIHRVHHSDPHVDSSTALRGHPLESLLAYSYFSVIVVMLGIDPLSLALRSLVAVVALAWHHSAVSLPARLDAVISLITPTPRTHRLHHARDVRTTDSNYGTLFTWWDRAFGTFTPGDVRPPGQTGLDGFDSAQAQSLLGVLSSPLYSPAPETSPPG